MEGEVKFRKFLINNGKPALKTIYDQRYDHWTTKDGKRKIIEIIKLNRETVGGNEADVHDEEQRKAKQLGINEFEKAIIHYEDDGRKIPEIYRDGRVYKKEIRDINYSFTVENWPHIKGFIVGAGGQFSENRRRYDIPVGAIVEVNNPNDFERLQKTFPFLDECNERGEIIKRNPYNKVVNEEIDMSKYPREMGELPESKIPRESPGQAVKELKEDKTLPTD